MTASALAFATFAPVSNKELSRMYNIARGMASPTHAAAEKKAAGGKIAAKKKMAHGGKLAAKKKK